MEELLAAQDAPEQTGHKIMIIAFVVLGLIAIIAPSVYFYMQYRNTQALLKNPQEAAKRDLEDTVTAVSKLVDVPIDEEPTVATVSDPDKLRNQPFFAKAINGDKVIVFANSRKAILYRPATNKIIEMAPVNVPETAGVSTTGMPEPTSPDVINPVISAVPIVATATPGTIQIVNVAVLNGTTTTGLANRMEQQLRENTANVAIAAKGNAARATEYPSTLVVDLTASHPKETKDISTLINGTISTFPEGEKKPDGADIMIIIGKNYVPPPIKTSPTPTL